MTTTADRSAGALNIGETLAYRTPDARFIVRLQHVRTDTFTVTVEHGPHRVDELCRTHATESDARDLAREVSKRLRDGATVAEVVDAIQPAAELITAVTAHLALAAAVRDLSPAARRAILTAIDGHITHGNGVSVSTLRSLESQHHAGDLTRANGIRKSVTGLDLNRHGRDMQAYLTANRPATLAA